LSGPEIYLHLHLFMFQTVTNMQWCRGGIKH